MKNYIYISLILTTCLFLSSCGEDELELAPQSEIAETNFYNNDREVEGAVLAIYDGLQELALREFALTEMRSDNTKSRSNEGDWAQFDQLNVAPTNYAVGLYWSVNYNVIFRANTVLAHLDVVQNETAKDQFEGEAKFTRALANFNLVQAYGDVPLIDQVVGITDADYFDRDDKNLVLALIVSDLKEAKELLPTKTGTEFGRATSAAAAALLAKVYLTQKNYSEAKVLLNELIVDSNYSLEDDYSDIFYSEGNDEILFAIPYYDDDSEESQDFSFEMSLGGGTGLNFLTSDFVNSADPTDTERAEVLFNPLDTYTIAKFLTSSSNARLCGNDWIVLRMADVYLMHAEAIMNGNNFTEDVRAIESYNIIRARVSLSTLPEDGTAQLTKEVLLYERRMELAFENHRFYDLIRFDLADEILGDYLTSTGYTYNPNGLLLPIPQSEINVSDGLLTQNPGY